MNKRREFITLLGGAATWPLAARAQQGGGMRRIGVLMGWSASDPEYRSRLAAFVQGLAQLGWTDGRNARIDVRWTEGKVDLARVFAKELAEVRPDVILAGGTPATAALQRETRTIPIVFLGVADPVGDGFIASVPRPGGNITGFVSVEASMAGKWLELLKEVAPRLRRVAVMFNPDTAPGGGSYFVGPFEAAARSAAVDAAKAPVHSDAEIETVIASLGQDQAGLVVMTDSFMAVHGGTVVSAAARHNVPTTFSQAGFARYGGLISYGPYQLDIYRHAASYVDRILRGAKPSDLPVEIPTKYELGINLKTAKALGLTVPPSLLVTADEVIE